MTFSLGQYLMLRETMLSDPEWEQQYGWQQTVQFPKSAEQLARDVIYVICNSGMKNTVARGIYDRIMAVIRGSRRETQLPFNHAGKRRAIYFVWVHRRDLFRAAKKAAKTGTLVEWCGELPWVGNITKYHLAKNLGADVAKPDRWLERIARESGETVDGLCQRLSKESGDRVATVDLVLWWAAANGHWKEST